MKTRRILAASTAALLAFGATAVIASAAAGDKVAGKTNTLTIGSSGTEVIVGGKVEGSSSGTTADFDYDGFDEDTLKGDAGDGINVSLTLKNAKKIKGEAKIIAEAVETPEDDNEKVDIEELDIGASDAVEKELAKVKAENVKIIKIKVGLGDKTKSSIGCPVTVTVDKTFKGAKVYHVNEDGSLTKLSSETQEGLTSGDFETTFTTNTFSPFIITTADLKASSAADTSSDASAATSDGTAASTNPETGIALAIAPVVLAAGAVAVVALKKKH